MKEQSKIGILGGGIGGLVCASELNHRLKTKAEIMVIDSSVYHLFQPALLHLALGERKLDSIRRPLERLNKQGINFINEEILSINPKKLIVNTNKGDHKFDYLIISLGAKLDPSAITGFSENTFNLYDSQGADQISKALNDFTGGKIVVVVASMPFKCPAAPYEMAFLLDNVVRKRKIRKKVEIVLATPEPQPMPLAGKSVGPMVVEMLEERGIEYLPQSQVKSVKKSIILKDKRINADLVIGIPPHSCPDVIIKSGLAKKDGWLEVDKYNMKTKYKNIYAIGDSTVIKLANGKPLPKAGVFAKTQAQIVARNLANIINGKQYEKSFSGEGSCFLEIGHKKAALAKGSFYHEPNPSFNVKSPSRRNYISKILYEKYWLKAWI